MNSYDFKSLNDKEFEVLCADLLGVVLGRRFERFKAGRDGGVDGRFFISPESEVVLQCKHWARTPIEQLIAHLAKKERCKIEKLKPVRYLLVVSNSLSRNDKKVMAKTLAPFVLSEEDIYGAEDLNGLLGENPDLERRHYKLWLHSSHVINHVLNAPLMGRSQYSLGEIHEKSSMYAQTASHSAAIEILEKHKTIIITGAPGVGKTTLAEQICLGYSLDGFDFYKIDQDIKEAESVLSKEVKQVFYFDDFLGRNYVEALSGVQTSSIVKFIVRIGKMANVRFILTSRSTILNQGKMLNDVFYNNNVQRNEFELHISALKPIDKAKILYNHIYNSGLSDQFVDEFYSRKRYRQVIYHKNFNPRLISFICDVERITVSLSGYWGFVEGLLNNPAEVWNNPFEAQQDDFSRSIVLLVALNGKPIESSVLNEAYSRYISRSENLSMQGRRDFLMNAKHLAGSLLTRNIASAGSTYDLFNPSIGDYVLGRYSGDYLVLVGGFLSLRTSNSLRALRSMVNGVTSKEIYAQVLNKMLSETADVSFAGYTPEYIAALVAIYIDLPSDKRCVSHDCIRAVIGFLAGVSVPANYGDYAKVFGWACGEGLLDCADLSVFLTTVLKWPIAESEMEPLSEVSSLVAEAGLLTSEVTDAIVDRVSEYFLDNLESEVSRNNLMDHVGREEYSYAGHKINEHIRGVVESFGIQDVLIDVVATGDLYEIVDSYFTDVSDDERWHYGGGSAYAPSDDGVDDLFERG